MSRVREWCSPSFSLQLINVSPICPGSVDDFESIRAALHGAYGAWANTDGFTIGEQREIHAGMRIFEIAKQAGTVRHYVWSSLDYALKVCISS